MRPTRRRHLSVISATTLSDPELLARIADDRDAMGELVARHQSRLLGFAISMLRNRSDAEEAVQDTFVLAHRNAASFRNESTVSTWLHTICRRQVLTRTRRKRLDTTELDNRRELVADAIDVDLAVAIDGALDELPMANREAFVLVDVLGYSRADAAAMLGIEANTMRARVARARVLLADALSGTDEEDVS